MERVADKELAIKSPEVFTMVVRTASLPKCPSTKVPGRLSWGLWRGGGEGVPRLREH